MCYCCYRIILTSCSQVTILVLGGGLALMTQSKYTSTPSRMSDATRDFPIRIFTWGGSKQKKKVKAWIASLSSCWWKVYAKANIRISIGKKLGVCVCIASPYFSEFSNKKYIICLNSSASLYIERMDVLTTLQIISYFLFFVTVCNYKKIYICSKWNEPFRTLPPLTSVGCKATHTWY